MEALEGGPHTLEPVMLSSAAHSGSQHLQSRNRVRFTTFETLPAIVSLMGALPEVFAEAQGMKRQAKQRYPFMSFDF